MYKVLIPSAGLGTRLGDIGKNINKALVSVANKPVISHVIEKFPKDVEIVIAIGHKGRLLKDYLEVAHPDRKITCVHIEHYYGSRSGLGHTILQCKEHLQCPFVFTPNDTLILEDIPTPYENWMGYAEVENTDQYRSLQTDSKGMVNKIYEKEDGLEVKPYIGLAGINDYKLFWQAMESGTDKGSILIGESYGLRQILQANVQVAGKKFTWYDTGTVANLQKARKAFEKKAAPNILEKPNESIWFVNNKVIKYHSDPSFISGRVQRAEVLKGHVPEVTDYRQNMYSYRMLPGNVVSKTTNYEVFENLLAYLDSFWEPVKLEAKEKSKFVDICNKFYKEKTEKRVQLYFDRFSEIDSVEIVNGTEIPTVKQLLDRVPWPLLINGTPAKMHGDLHFENILMAETGEFYLLDWRQSFGGLTSYGDLYYDLAKLLHGLIVSHELVNKECYSVSHIGNIINYDLHRKHSLIENEAQFQRFLATNGHDVYKVQLLTSLIFLNIAPLHHEPYSKMLFYLGKESLYRLLEEKNVN
jgi:NDP-sugar pyrophosphorylase family protein/thiamine kinase-like enzyme